MSRLTHNTLRLVVGLCLLVLVVTILTVTPPRTLCAGEIVSVELASGRRLQGEIAPRTNDEKLWLRTGEATLYIDHPILWERVVQGTHAGETLTRGELQALARTGGQAEEVAPAAEAIPNAPPVGPRFQGIFVEAAPALEPLAIPPALATVSADAYIANWDRDVEVDGLVVHVTPIDERGFVVPVSGHVHIELFAPQVRAFHAAPRSRGTTLERIAEWTEPLTPEMLGPRGYVVKLPYRRVHPEFDLDILPHGLLHVSLVVPGAGVFETSLDHVRVRPWSPTRDDLWRNDSRRFLPTEQTGRK